MCLAGRRGGGGGEADEGAFGDCDELLIIIRFDGGGDEHGGDEGGELYSLDLDVSLSSDLFEFMLDILKCFFFRISKQFKQFLKQPSEFDLKVSFMH